MKDFDFEESNRIFVNVSLYAYYRVLWAKNKILHHLQKIFSFYVSNSYIKIRIKRTIKELQLPKQQILKSTFQELI